MLILGGLALLTAALVGIWPGMLHACTSSCQQYQLNPASAHILARDGFGLRAYAIGFAILLGSTTLVWYGLAGLIIWRQPQDRGAVVGACFLALFPLLALGTLTNWAQDLEASVGLAALILFGLLFPDGHFKPRWTRWLAVMIVVMLIPGPYTRILSKLWVIPVVLLPVTVVWVQIYRYRRLSSWAERQRSKWAFAGMISGILGLVSIFIAGTIAYPSDSSGMGSGNLVGVLVNAGIAVLPLVIPVSIAIAVLRSQLWDIDRVISRALAYTALTVLLVSLYAGGVIGFQALIGFVAVGGSAPAIVLTTLIVAALFGPLRRRMQTLIDRRFYRSRYDAALTVSSFTEHLRDELDIDRLTAALSSTVHETLHPSSVSLWLREQ
ncbi:MAG TPA: hypothetical protein VFB34_06440 [Chloroflexota bacterium]|nr:hypothetical protein [Chloroflexota bacterium]